MRMLTISIAGHVFRWSGGSFITVQTVSRMYARVPDDMIPLPESINRSKATEEDIRSICQRYIEEAS
jgi:hypothetical protein